MHDEDIFLRSNKGFAYLCVAPCILFSAAVWFTPNSAGIVIAHTFQVYFSILLFYLSLRVWSLRDNFDGRYSKELKLIAIAPALLAFLGVLLTLYLNPAWGIGFLTVGFYLFRFVRISFQTRFASFLNSMCFLWNQLISFSWNNFLVYFGLLRVR